MIIHCEKPEFIDLRKVKKIFDKQFSGAGSVNKLMQRSSNHSDTAKKTICIHVPKWHLRL